MALYGPLGRGSLSRRVGSFWACFDTLSLPEHPKP